MRRRSLWVYHVNSGGCNGCDIEILAALSPRYDPERLGVKLVESPRHADAILLTGPITLQSLPRVVEAIRAAGEVSIVAIGACACGGGIWHDSSAVVGGVPSLLKYSKELGIEDCIREVVYVPGCPPRPHAILYGLALLTGAVSERAGDIVKKIVVARNV